MTVGSGRGGSGSEETQRLLGQLGGAMSGIRDQVDRLQRLIEQQDTRINTVQNQQERNASRVEVQIEKLSDQVKAAASASADSAAVVTTMKEELREVSRKVSGLEEMKPALTQLISWRSKAIVFGGVVITTGTWFWW